MNAFVPPAVIDGYAFVLRPVGQEHVPRRGIEFVLELALLGLLHRLQDPQRGNLRRLPDQADLQRALHQPQLIENGRQVADLERRKPRLQ